MVLSLRVFDPRCRSGSWVSFEIVVLVDPGCSPESAFVV